MEQERIALSARERLKILHDIEQGHLRQVEAARRLRLSGRQVQRLLTRVRAEGDRGVVHRLRGKPSNRKIPNAIEQRVCGNCAANRRARSSVAPCGNWTSSGLPRSGPSASSALR